jgi:hypothetical protein
VVAGTTGDGADVASVHSVCVGLASHCSARHERALLWTLFAWSAWAQPATGVAGTTGEIAALASVRLVGMGSARHCGGGHNR